MKLRKLLVIASIFMTASSAALASEDFSNFTIFGDSLSDMGNSPLAPETNNGGPIWVQNLALLLGIPPISPSSAGGSDYAIAGDQTGPEPFGPTDGGQLAQVQGFLAGNANRANPHGLYSLWAGANDIKNGLLGGFSAASIINNATTNITTAANLLHYAGAKYIMILNIPDLGATPIVRALGPTVAQAFTAVSIAFDQTLNTKLNSIGFDVIQPDAFGALAYIQKYPQLFGFSSSFGSVCDSNGMNCHTQNTSQYVFFDGFHPSVASGYILSDYVLSLFQGAQVYGILGEEPFNVIDAQNANLNSELINIRTGTESVPVGQFKAFLVGNYNPNNVDQDGFNAPGYNADNFAYTAGFDYRLNNNFVVGAAVGRDNDDINFNHPGGEAQLNENTLSLFGGWQYQQLYATTELNYGIPEFNVDRNVQLGIANFHNNGNTDGVQYGVAGTFGWNIIDTELKTGPYVDAEYQNLHINGYQEAGIAPFVDMNYESQFNQSIVGGIGWQVAYCGTTLWNVQVLPYAQAEFDHQFMNPDRTILGNPISANGGNGAFPFVQPSGNFVTLGAGIQGVLTNNISMTLGYDAELSTQYADTHSQDVLLNLAIAI